MSSKLYLTSSPHLHDKSSTQKIMLDVIIATLPIILASTIIFGMRSLVVIFTTVLSCVLSEYLSCKIMKRPNSIKDLSAVVTGILLAFSLSVSIPIGIAAFGGFVAIVVIKQFFGGLGQNFVNPALCSRIILLISFPAQMTNWPEPFAYLKGSADIITSATPLDKSVLTTVTYFDLFFGNIPGCIGEICSMAILLGGIYLLVKKVISIIIPIFFIGTVFVLTFLMGGDPIFHIFSGGLLLGAFFMATDYVTSPVTRLERIIFAVGCGFFTVIIRIFGNLPEGVSFSIVLMNILTPLIEKLTFPKPFGKRENI